MAAELQHHQHFRGGMPPGAGAGRRRELVSHAGLWISPVAALLAKLMRGTSLKKAEDLIAFTAQEVCRACSGQLLAGEPDAVVTAVSTDTREDLGGALFIGLRGENFNGGEYVAEALERGAMGVLVEGDDARRLAASTDEDPVIIAVDDTGQALGRLAALVAAGSGARVVAITGSSGKTSTKDILRGLLQTRLKVVASRESFNNEVGVPLTLLLAGEDTDAIIVEMGMQAPGEIGDLCRIASPGIAIITNIGPAHLKYSGSIENIAAGKAEIATCLPAGGGLVYPYGEQLLAPHLEGLDLEMLSFGFDADADIHPVSETFTNDSLHAVIDCRGSEVEVRFNFAARHHLLNAMAAIGAYMLMGMPLEELAEAAGRVTLSGMRGELIRLDDGTVLINDCYNANPLSMESSLRYLHELAAGRRTVAIIGDMGELGDDARSYHNRVGRAAARMGTDLIIAVGELSAEYVAGAAAEDSHRQDLHSNDCQGAISAAGVGLRPGDVVLVKASRFMELEHIVQSLVGENDGDNEGEPAGDGAGRSPEKEG